MIRKAIARYVIRKTWNLAKDWDAMWRRHPDLTKNERLGIALNILSLITTALGGDWSWMPRNVVEEFYQTCREQYPYATSAPLPPTFPAQGT